MAIIMWPGVLNVPYCSNNPTPSTTHTWKNCQKKTSNTKFCHKKTRILIALLLSLTLIFIIATTIRNDSFMREYGDIILYGNGDFLVDEFYFHRHRGTYVLNLKESKLFLHYKGDYDLILTYDSENDSLQAPDIDDIPGMNRVYADLDITHFSERFGVKPGEIFERKPNYTQKNVMK